MAKLKDASLKELATFSHRRLIDNIADYCEENTDSVREQRICFAGASFALGRVEVLDETIKLASEYLDRPEYSPPEDFESWPEKKSE